MLTIAAAYARLDAALTVAARVLGVAADGALNAIAPLDLPAASPTRPPEAAGSQTGPRESTLGRGDRPTSTVVLMCKSTHVCVGERERGCTRLAHTSLHHCSWCGKTWTDQPAETGARP